MKPKDKKYVALVLEKELHQRIKMKGVALELTLQDVIKLAIREFVERD